MYKKPVPGSFESFLPVSELEVDALLVGLLVAVLAVVLWLKFTHTCTMAIFTTSSFRSVPMANNGIGGEIPTNLLKLLAPKSKACIERLRTCRIDRPDLSHQPTSKLAAVLVLLYEQAGELRVLLTTRSKSLRAHPGQTALPGGKTDDGDEDLVWTAFREANEEVGLPLPSALSNIHVLTTLPPFLSASQLLVTPVVALFSSVSSSSSISDDPSGATSDTLSGHFSHPVLGSLTPSLTEVDRIFDHPLEAILDPQLLLNNREPLVDKGEDWPYGAEELHNRTDIILGGFDGLAYRMHRFRTCASPIKGLTADILISVAELAYGQKPVYGRYPPDSGSGRGGDGGEAYRTLVKRRIEEYEKALEGDEKVIGKVDWHVGAGANGSVLPASTISP